MDIAKIKKIISLLDESDLKRIHFKEGEFEIEVERESKHQVKHFHSEQLQQKTIEKKEETFVVSPMVGTFYHSQSSEKSPYVNVGDVVNEDTVVCIIEAMKVMNEVKSDKKGKVVEILVNNTDPVEYGTKLFRIE